MISKSDLTPVLAVSFQTFVSATNYVFFIIVASQFSAEFLVLFTSTIAINGLAFSIAEGGLSFVAPKAVSNLTEGRQELMGAFLLISLALYLFFLASGALLWWTLNSNSLHIPLLLGYALWFLPSVILPPWSTFHVLSFIDLFMMIAIRTGALVMLLLNPTLSTIYGLSYINLGIILVIVYMMRRRSNYFVLPQASVIINASRSLKSVFIPKTASFSVYSSVPFVIVAVSGANMSSLYVVGERFKSLYSTVFMPIVQAAYLGLVKSGNGAGTKYILVASIFAFNIITAGCIMLALEFDLLQRFIPKQLAIFDLYLYLWASFCSVSTSTLIYLKIIPSSGGERTLQLMLYFQIMVFFASFLIYASFPLAGPHWILLVAEFFLLIATLFALFRTRFFRGIF